eukprot:7386657-Prymnesium_polylepis.1
MWTGVAPQPWGAGSDLQGVTAWVRVSGQAVTGSGGSGERWRPLHLLRSRVDQPLVGDFQPLGEGLGVA